MIATIKLVECPRDAMQGIKAVIPTKVKIAYLQSLMDVGFHTIDIGSFVSPKAIPQMHDTAQVIDALTPLKTMSRFLVIVANVRGACQAATYPAVDDLGYPFSISENFQMRNTHKTIAESLEVIKTITDVAHRHGKGLVVYLSMGFGNPYGDPWNSDIVEEWLETLINIGVTTVSLSDTTGSGTPQDIDLIFNRIIPKYPHVAFGAHLHATPYTWYAKLNAAYKAGCRRFDGAIMGFGGCPMAGDSLTGNVATEKIITYLRSQNEAIPLKMTTFEGAYNKAMALFNRYM